MVALKMGTRSETTYKTKSACYQFVINFDKSVKTTNLLPSIANLLPSTCIYIHINYLHSEFSHIIVDLKWKIQNSFTKQGYSPAT